MSRLRREDTMQLMQPDPAAAVLGLRAMKTIASAAGPIGPAQRGLMEAAKKVILRVDADIDTLPPVTPAELAAGFPGAELREQFASGMLVMAVADGVPASETLAKVEAFGAALGIASPVLADLRLLAEQHMLLFKLDFLRRGHIADIMKNELRNKGPLGFAKSVLRMRGLTEDPAARRALPRLGETARGHAGPRPDRLLQPARLQRAGRAQRLPGS